MRPGKMTLRPHDSIAVAAILFFLALSLGCESLHRDIEKQLPPDDAGTVDDTGSPEKDVGEDTGQDVREDTGHDDCEPGLSCGPCDEGETICQEGQQLCQGAVDLSSDDEHCGVCNHRCETTISGAEAFCQSGECTAECIDAEETICDDANACVDLDQDDDHCGACNHGCETTVSGAEAFCQSGECTVECMDDEAAFCEDADACVNLDHNLDHCGGCDQPCQTFEPDADAFCDDGQCIIECDLPEKSYCDGVDECVDLDSDLDHCGGCEQACTSSGDEDLATCEGGECVCVEDAELCDDECVDLQSDDDHCGACHNACPGPQDCINGECQNV